MTTLTAFLLATSPLLPFMLGFVLGAASVIGLFVALTSADEAAKAAANEPRPKPESDNAQREK